MNPKGSVKFECDRCSNLLSYSGVDIQLDAFSGSERGMGPETGYRGDCTYNCPICENEIYVAHEVWEQQKIGDRPRFFSRAPRATCLRQKPWSVPYFLRSAPTFSNTWSTSNIVHILVQANRRPRLWRHIFIRTNRVYSPHDVQPFSRADLRKKPRRPPTSSVM